MILSKSKIYELRLIKNSFVDKNFNHIFLDSKKYKCWHWGSFEAIEVNYQKILAFSITKGANSWNRMAEHAAVIGNKKLLKIFIHKGKSGNKEHDIWNTLFFSSCKGNQPKIIDKCLSHLSKFVTTWNWGLNYAAEEGRINLVQYFISKGARSWESAMTYAEDAGQKKLKRYFRKKKKAEKKKQKK